MLAPEWSSLASTVSTTPAGRCDACSHTRMHQSRISCMQPAAPARRWRRAAPRPRRRPAPRPHRPGPPPAPPRPPAAEPAPRGAPAAPCPTGGCRTGLGAASLKNSTKGVHPEKCAPRGTIRTSRPPCPWEPPTPGASAAGCAQSGLVHWQSATAAAAAPPQLQRRARPCPATAMQPPCHAGLQAVRVRSLLGRTAAARLRHILVGYKRN